MQDGKQGSRLAGDGVKYRTLQSDTKTKVGMDIITICTDALHYTT